MSVVVIGSINCDVITYAARAPRPGESLTGYRYAMVQGGKGANQAIATRRLGCATTYIGRVGKDPFGHFVLENLKRNDLPIDGVVVDPEAATGIAVIGIDDSGQNAITVIPGANLSLSSTQVESDRTALEKAQVLLCQLETPLAPSLAAARMVRPSGGLVVLDPAPIPTQSLTTDALAHFDIATPNELETEAMTGITPVDMAAAEAAAARINELGIRIAIVKMGARGVFLRTEGISQHVPPFPVTPVDTLAAGDCFNGGLAFALSRARPLVDAVRFAAACGALACTKKGASDSAPRLEEARLLLGEI